MGQLTELGVTALAVAEKFDGIEAHPVDRGRRRTARLLGCARSGRRIDRRGTGSAGRRRAERSRPGLGRADRDRRAAPQVPWAVDADIAGLILLAWDGQVRDATAGAAHESVDPARKLFEVSPSGAPRKPIPRALSSSAY